MSRIVILIAVAALAAAGCSNHVEPANDAAAGHNASAEVAAPQVTNRAETVANTASSEAPAAATPQTVTYTLAGNGLAPGLTFGMAEAEAVKAATAAFGAPTRRDKNDECGEGPMNFVHFGDLQLGFQEGKLAGWSLGGPKPALKTSGGLGIGAPRSALGDVDVDEESSIGPEFAVDGIGGFLDEQDRVMALWAGYPYQFR